MRKEIRSREIRLQENDNLTATGWLVWLLCLLISISASLTVFAWAKGDLDWQVSDVSSVFTQEAELE